MRTAQLYESPFTDFSPRGVEGVFDTAQVTQLVSILDRIRQAAAI
jgi:type I restriction enzyme R subunit